MALLCLVWTVFSLPSLATGLPPGVSEPFIGWQSPFVGAGRGGASDSNFVPGVWTQTVWDDGRGPALYAAGNFVTMNDVYSPAIARWDGSSWERVPVILDRDESFGFVVSALSVFQGELIVGGAFSDIDGQTVRGILRYDGQAWHPLTGSQGSGTAGSVRALTVFQGELIVGGEFIQAGGLAVNGLARWTGSDWLPLPNPFQGNATVRSLVVYQGELIAGGSIQSSTPAISYVGRWNGSVWQPLAGPSGQGVAQDPGFGTQVHALRATSSGLVVGGRFASAGGVPARNVARWDGANWSALGAGLGGVTHQVLALETLGETLYVGGSFPGSGAVASPNVIAWNGAQWQALEGPDGAGAGLDNVMSLMAFNDEIYVAGLISQAGGVISPGIARWNGSGFARVTSGAVTGLMGGSPRAAVMFNGQLVVGGGFTEAGAAGSRRVAAWDGSAWQALGEGFSNGEVRALVEYQGQLIAGGSFTFAPDQNAPPGRTVNRVARWDGSAWQPMANGFGGIVETLHSHQGQLFAGGWFTAAGGFGGATMTRIARWNGTAWEAVDGGFANGQVASLHTHAGELVAGGSFIQMGNGNPALRVATWNATEGWRAVGSELTTGVVRSLASLQGQLYAGGSFGAPPSGSSPRHLARWDGANWQPVSLGGAELSWGVNHMVASSDELFISGGFEAIGPLTLHCVARYSPTRGWRRMSGPNGIGMRRVCGGVDQLLLLDQAVIAVGNMIVAGGKVAHGIGYWSRREDSIFGDRFQSRP